MYSRIKFITAKNGARVPLPSAFQCTAVDTCIASALLQFKFAGPVLPALRGLIHGWQVSSVDKSSACKLYILHCKANCHAGSAMPCGCDHLYSGLASCGFEAEGPTPRRATKNDA